MINYGPLIKYGLIVGLVLAWTVGAFFYGAHWKQIEWDASITQQAILSASQVIEQARNSAHAETQYIERAGKTRIVTKEVKKEVVRYVETHPRECILTPSFEWMFDRISGMLDAGEERLPPADAASSKPDVPATVGPLLTCTEVLRAYEYAIGQWHIERDRTQALSAWVQSAYDLSVTH